MINQVSKIKVLQCVGSLEHGGVEKWMSDVVSRVDHSRFQFDFLVRVNKIGHYEPAFESHGCQIIRCLDHKNPIRYFQNFAHVLDEYGPYDILHAHQQDFNGILIWLAKHHQIRVRLAHSHNDLRNSGIKANLAWKTYYKLSRHLVRRYATHGLACSGKAAEDLFGEDWTKDQRWTVLPYGMDLERFQVGSAEISATRLSLGIPGNRFVIGHVGRFADQKNHKFLIEIAEKLINRALPVHFLLVGDGDLRPGILKIIETKGLKESFTLVAASTEIPLLMATSMDAFLFPSLHEGLPIALLEAQASGLKSFVSSTISPDTFICPELVSPLDLGHGADTWADYISAFMAKPLIRQIPDLAGTPVDIRTSVFNLIKLYATSAAGRGGTVSGIPQSVNQAAQTDEY